MYLLSCRTVITQSDFLKSIFVWLNSALDFKPVTRFENRFDLTEFRGLTAAQAREFFWMP